MDVMHQGHRDFAPYLASAPATMSKRAGGPLRAEDWMQEVWARGYDAARSTQTDFIAATSYLEKKMGAATRTPDAAVMPRKEAASAEAQRLCVLGEKDYAHGRFQMAQTKLLGALQLSIVAGNHGLEAEVLYFLGMVHQALGDHDRALILLEKSHSLGQKVGETEAVKWSGAAIQDSLLRRLDQRIPGSPRPLVRLRRSSSVDLQPPLAAMEETAVSNLSNRTSEAQLYADLVEAMDMDDKAREYGDAGNHFHAARYYLTSAGLFRKGGHFLLESNAYCLEGLCHLRGGCAFAAAKSFHRGLERSVDLGHINFGANALRGLGDAFHALDEPGHAGRAYHLALGCYHHLWGRFTEDRARTTFLDATISPLVRRVEACFLHASPPEIVKALHVVDDNRARGQELLLTRRSMEEAPCASDETSEAWALEYAAKVEAGILFYSVDQASRLLHIYVAAPVESVDRVKGRRHGAADREGLWCWTVETVNLEAHNQEADAYLSTPAAQDSAVLGVAESKHVAVVRPAADAAGATYGSGCQFTAHVKTSGDNGTISDAPGKMPFAPVDLGVTLASRATLNPDTVDMPDEVIEAAVPLAASITAREPQKRCLDDTCPEDFLILGHRYRLLIRPVEERLASLPRLIIVPDPAAGLSTVPFAALINPKNGKYLVEDFAVSVVPSFGVLREMVKRMQQPAPIAPPRSLVVGNPDCSGWRLEEPVLETFRVGDRVRVLLLDAAANFSWSHAWLMGGRSSDGFYEVLHPPKGRSPSDPFVQGSRVLVKHDDGRSWRQAVVLRNAEEGQQLVEYVSPPPNGIGHMYQWIFTHRMVPVGGETNRVWRSHLAMHIDPSQHLKLMDNGFDRFDAGAETHAVAVELVGPADPDVEGRYRVRILEGGAAGEELVVRPSRLLRVAPEPAPALQGSEDEAARVWRALRSPDAPHPVAIRGRNATLERVVAEMELVTDVMHFAMHAYADRQVGGRSGLLLAGPSHDGAILTAHKILSLKLGARLAVPSGCSTGCGETRAEGVVGLERAFLVAGVQAVVTMLWDVFDARQQWFMSRMYRKRTKAAAALTSTRRTAIFATPGGHDVAPAPPPGTPPITLPATPPATPPAGVLRCQGATTVSRTRCGPRLGNIPRGRFGSIGEAFADEDSCCMDAPDMEAPPMGDADIMAQVQRKWLDRCRQRRGAICRGAGVPVTSTDRALADVIHAVAAAAKRGDLSKENKIRADELWREHRDWQQCANPRTWAAFKVCAPFPLGNHFLEG